MRAARGFSRSAVAIRNYFTENPKHTISASGKSNACPGCSAIMSTRSASMNADMVPDVGDSLRVTAARSITFLTESLCSFGSDDHGVCGNTTSLISQA